MLQSPPRRQLGVPSSGPAVPDTKGFAQANKGAQGVKLWKKNFPRVKAPKQLPMGVRTHAVMWLHPRSLPSTSCHCQAQMVPLPSADASWWNLCHWNAQNFWHRSTQAVRALSLLHPLPGCRGNIYFPGKSPWRGETSQTLLTLRSSRGHCTVLGFHALYSPLLICYRLPRWPGLQEEALSLGVSSFSCSKIAVPAPTLASLSSIDRALPS